MELLFQRCFFFYWIGAGYAIIIVNLICTMYYNVIIAYPILFIVKSFTKTLPWMHCNNPWNTPHCLEVRFILHSIFYVCYLLIFIHTLGCTYRKFHPKCSWYWQFNSFRSQSLQNTGRWVFSVSDILRSDFNKLCRYMQTSSLVGRFWK